jgi:hypothetical protein
MTGIIAVSELHTRTGAPMSGVDACKWRKVE